MRFIFLMALMTGCSPSNEDSGALSLDEWWTCDHIESEYSANVQAETKKIGDWSSVVFWISDDDDIFSVNLKPQGHDLWYAETNLLDLDCTSSELRGFFEYVQ